MFNTNTKFFINENIKSNYLKKIFSVSTDKAAYPSSILGISKYLMEQKLAYIKTKNEILYLQLVLQMLVSQMEVY